MSGSSSIGDNASSSGSNNAYSEAARISALEMDLQNANSNLAMEKEQVSESVFLYGGRVYRLEPN
ncbi:MAG: hypothetical protein ACI8RD_010900 [Bacillariaceae sp.]